MRIAQYNYSDNEWNEIAIQQGFSHSEAQLVFVFGERTLIADPSAYLYIYKLFPNADIVMGSTSGEIYNNAVHDNSIIVTAVYFEKTTIKTAVTHIKEHEGSYEAGAEVIKQLLADDLSFVFVLSDGNKVNGSELVKGLNHTNSKTIPITGGLAGDADRFQKTLVSLNDIPSEGNIVAIGFYGKDLIIGHGSMGGWEMFGLERTITRSKANVLYQIDQRDALDIYKEYLGPYAKELPAAALLFPLSIKLPGSAEPIVRTILSIDEKEKTMTFAGDIPEGSAVRLMRANFENLIDAAAVAARNCAKLADVDHPELVFLVSCVGRKLVLNQRITEEIEEASAVVGEKAVVTGFYSYGEISPFKPLSRCELHNQTLTITSLTERK